MLYMKSVFLKTNFLALALCSASRPIKYISFDAVSSFLYDF